MVSWHKGMCLCFAEVEGYSKFGSYTGNGSTDGPFVYTGFTPAYIMIKQTNAVNSWNIHDIKRGVGDDRLKADTSEAETTGNDYLDIISNGFKLRSTSANHNTSGGNYIYMAFASNPFKNSLAR